MKTIRIVGVVAFILLIVASSAAQLDRAGLTGTVTDSSGRVLPQTHIVAVHNTSGLRREATSSSSGVYDLPELPVGVYTVTFSHDGFKQIEFENVEQAVNQTRTLNAILQVS